MHKPISLKELLHHVQSDPQNWNIRLMDFVDDFRSRPDLSVMQDPFDGPHDRWSALLASTADYLCKCTRY